MDKFKNIVICMYEQEKIRINISKYIEIIRKLKKKNVKMYQEYFVFSLNFHFNKNQHLLKISYMFLMF